METKEKKKGKHRILKWILLVVAVFLILTIVIGTSADREAENKSKENSTSDNIHSAENQKQKAKENDAIINSGVHLIENYYSKLDDMILSLDSRESNLPDIYSLCDQILEYVPTFENRLKDIQDSTANEYINSVTNYMGNLRLIADDLKDFIDNAEYSSYESVKEGIQLIPTYLENISTARNQYLTQAGYTDEEISKILEE